MRVLGLAITLWGLAACGGAPPVDPAPPSDPGRDAEQRDPVVEADTRPDLPPIALRLSELASDDGQAHEALRELTRGAPARAVGSPALQRAEDWATGMMRELGLTDVHREPVVVTRWKRGAAPTLVMEPKSGAVPLTMLAVPGSNGTARRGYRRRVERFVDLKQFAEAGRNAKGSIVFWDPPLPASDALARSAYHAACAAIERGIREATRRRAAVVLVRSPTSEMDDHPRLLSIDTGKIPVGVLSPRSAQLLEAELARGELLRARYVLPCSRDVEPAIVSNVVGEWRGATRPDEIILLAARLDGWDVGQGAHEHGADVVQCLEAMRLLIASGARLDRTVRVVLYVDGDLPGRGLGSYARDHWTELSQHFAVVSSDTLGFSPVAFTTAGDDATVDGAIGALARLDVIRLVDDRLEDRLRVLRESGVSTLALRSREEQSLSLCRCTLDRFDSVAPQVLERGAALLACVAAQLARSS